MEDTVRENIIEIIKKYQKNNPSICIEDKVSKYFTLVQEVSEYFVLNDIQIQVEDINITRAGMPDINGNSCYPDICISLSKGK